MSPSYSGSKNMPGKRTEKMQVESKAFHVGLPGSFFDPEDGGSIFFRNVG
jgi:hypothetical protein